MPALFGAIGWIVAKFVGDNVLRFVAGKALLTVLFLVILPLILNNVMADVLQIGIDLVGENVGGLSTTGNGVVISGAAGWVCSCLKISQCFAVIMSAVMCKASLRMIPFLRV